MERSDVIRDQIGEKKSAIGDILGKKEDLKEKKKEYLMQQLSVSYPL